MIKKYLNDIAKTTAHEDQREESYYPAVATLMTEFANSINKKNESVTILPKKTEAGNRFTIYLRTIGSRKYKNNNKIYTRST